MQSQLLEEASKLFPDTQKLINMVSRRVRQLSHGATPLVDPGARIIWSDIALREIIAGKLVFREGPGPGVNGDSSHSLPNAKSS